MNSSCASEAICRHWASNRRFALGDIVPVTRVRSQWYSAYAERFEPLLVVFKDGKGCMKGVLALERQAPTSDGAPAGASPPPLHKGALDARRLP